MLLRCVRAGCVVSILAAAQPAIAAPNADVVCPPGNTASVLWKGHVWQQDVTVRSNGELARVTLTFIGPAAAIVRLRRGPAPSSEQVLAERIVRIDEAGTFDVTLDVSASHIDVQAGAHLVVEVEGVDPQGQARGAIVGAAERSDCPTVVQNGTTQGVSADAHLAVRMELCSPSCEPSQGPEIVVAPRALVRARDERLEERHQQQHMDSTWTQPQPRKRRNMAAVHLGVQAQGVHVDVPDAKLGLGGGAAIYGVALGTVGAISVRAAGSAGLGGQTTGVSTRLAADGSVGPALRVNDTLHLFARAGLQIDSQADQELDTSVFTLPAVSAGLAVAGDKVIFEVAPRGGTALRGVYAPGDELEGRRHHREAGIGTSWGGTAALVSRPFALSAAFDRIEQTNALTMLRGFACAFVSVASRPPHFSVCAFGHGWRGRVIGAGGVSEATSVAAGLSFGIGDADAF
jgi:hypothetical protein